MRQGQYARAETVFHRLAEDEKNPPKIAMEARYYEAECLRLQEDLPGGGPTPTRYLLGKFPNNPFREQAVQHMFTIANYWLEDHAGADGAGAGGPRRQALVRVEPCCVTRWTRPSRPRRGGPGRRSSLREGAVERPASPLADQSLFLCGSVKYYDEDFAEADYYFSQIHERNPNSPLAAKAVELAIVSPRT